MKLTKDQAAELKSKLSRSCYNVIDEMTEKPKKQIFEIESLTTESISPYSVKFALEEHFGDWQFNVKELEKNKKLNLFNAGDPFFIDGDKYYIKSIDLDWQNNFKELVLVRTL